MKTPRYEIGDVVRVKTLDELHRELGEEIETPCGFVEKMYKFCGQCMEVIGVHKVPVPGENFYYRLEDDGYGWDFDECVLDDFFIDDEQQVDVANITISYESLF